MRSLYEINQDYLEALENTFVIDEETGEVIMQEDLLDSLDGEFTDKVDNICCYIKDLESLSDGIKAEKKALDERMKANDMKIERLKNYISQSLHMRGKSKLETPRNKLSFRTSKSVDVMDEMAIDMKYWREEVTMKLDKKSILEELKNGAEIEGCQLLVKDNLQIK